MASVASVRRAGAGVLAAVITAALVWFGTGLAPAWPLTWLAPLPVLLFAIEAPWWAAAAAASAGQLVGTLNVWHYLHGVLHLPAPVIAGLYLMIALPSVLAVLAYRALVRRSARAPVCSPVWPIVAYPAVQVAFEYTIAASSPHGTAFHLAYSQLACLPVLQLASLTGPWGITFLLGMVPAALATAWWLRGTRGRALRVLAATGAVVAAVVGFGAARLARAPGPTVRVGLVASDPPTSPDIAEGGIAAADLLAAYAQKAAELAAQGAQVIVLPEKLAVAVDPDTGNADARLQAVADRSGATVVVGLVHVMPPVTFNEARIYQPARPVVRYAKHHLLPPFESPMQAGDTLTVLPRSPSSWGVAICKDMDFPPLSRAYGRAGAGVLLVPAWDFVADRVWHGHMAILRGVESGFAVVRAAKQGYLTASDSRGRIVAEVASDAAPFTTLVADVPAMHDDTLYLVLGDWFAWLAIAALGAALTVLVRRRAGPRSV